MKTKRNITFNRPIFIGGGSFAFYALVAGVELGVVRVMSQWKSYVSSIRFTSCFALPHDLQDRNHSTQAGRKNVILPLMEAIETIHRLGRHRATLSA